MRFPRLLPHAELPAVLLEIHGVTGFADAFTHVSEENARVEDLPLSACAELLAEACNIGLRAYQDMRVDARSCVGWSS